MFWMLEDLHSDCPPRTIDLGAGDSPQKQTFRSVPHNVGDFYIVPKNHLRYVVAAQQLIGAIEAPARAVLAGLGLDNSVRRFLKHAPL
jgi:hypothetical protein